MILDYGVMVVAAVAFALHVVGKYKADPVPMPFGKWAKEQLTYLLTSVALCVVGVIMRYELMDMLGMTKPLVFVFILCYGGGLVISQALGIKPASDARANAVAK
jgi:Co/Zn/Cd efflux system component